VLHKLQLSKDELILEFPNLEKQNAAKIAYDEIKILPSRKPVRKGLQLIKCGLYRNSQYLKTLNVNTRIRTFQNVVVSKTKLGRFTIVSPGDLQLARLETTHLTKKTFSSLKEMSGLRTTRLIQTGDVITENLVETLPVIARGGGVHIRFKRGLLEITTPGIARQDGKIGDEIRVKCVESKKSYTAKVIDAKTVLVNL
jgi:flagella basal body P-ring formation protein FlgA